MRAERLLRIVVIMQSKDRVTAAELARELEHARQRIHVTQGSWGPEPPKSTLRVLQAAIWADRLISLRYRTSPVTLVLAPPG